MPVATKKVEKIIRGGSRPGKTLKQARGSGGPVVRKSGVNGRGRTSILPKVIRENPQLFDGVRKFGDFISVVDFADIFGVTTNTARGWIKNGFLPNPQVSADPGDRKQYLSVEGVISAMLKYTEV